MVRSIHDLVPLSLAAAVLLAGAGCKSPEGEPNPRPPAGEQEQQPQAQQQPQAPAQQQPAAPAQEGQAQEGQAAQGGELQVSEAAMAEAKQTFDTVCATCHGTSGKGDGPASAGFPVKPRDYTDPAWQKSISDEDLRKVIVQGGPAIGKSPLMPGNPQLADKPEVVDGLVKLIRDFGKQ